MQTEIPFMPFTQGHHQWEWLLWLDFDTCQFSASFYNIEKNTLSDASLPSKTFHHVACTEENCGLILNCGFGECYEYSPG